jgi:hypothetical protein
LVAVSPFYRAGRLARVALWERARLLPGYGDPFLNMKSDLRSPIGSYFPLY